MSRDMKPPSKAALIRAYRQPPDIVVKVVIGEALIRRGLMEEVTPRPDRGIRVKLTERGRRWNIA